MLKRIFIFIFLIFLNMQHGDSQILHSKALLIYIIQEIDSTTYDVGSFWIIDSNLYINHSFPFFELDCIKKSGNQSYDKYKMEIKKINYKSLERVLRKVDNFFSFKDINNVKYEISSYLKKSYWYNKILDGTFQISITELKIDYFVAECSVSDFKKYLFDDIIISRSKTPVVIRAKLACSGNRK